MVIETKKAVLILIFFALIAFSAITLYFFSQSADFVPASPTPSAKISPETQTLPEPTGNANDLLKDLSQESLSMEQIAEEENSDSILEERDLQLIDEFGQSYNENEL